MEICDNSRTVWLIPHMKTESKGSEARYSFRLGCFTLIFLVLILAMIEAIFPSCSTDKKSAHANKKVTRQLRFPQYFWSFYRSKQLNNSLLTVRSSSGSSPSSPPRQQCATWTTAVQESPRSYSRHVRVVVVGEREPQHDLLLWLQKPTKISHEAYTSVVYSTSDRAPLLKTTKTIFFIYFVDFGGLLSNQMMDGKVRARSSRPIWSTIDHQIKMQGKWSYPLLSRFHSLFYLPKKMWPYL